MPVFLLSDDISFPSPEMSMEDGLLAIGGDLNPDRLLCAYRCGIFPWYCEGQPILWWSPNPRLVLYPNEMRVSGSMKKIIRQNRFRFTMDQAFEQVISECAGSRAGSGDGTWITDEMIRAYCRLHKAGYAHSVEAWYMNSLAGGLYGVSLGRCFFGESMFTRVSNASKAAFVKLVEYLKSRSFDLIDCQVTTGHLKSFGAREISRVRFLEILRESVRYADLIGTWGDAGEQAGFYDSLF